mgnify:CR=1 FL=1
MKVKFLKDLNDSEKLAFEQSTLYHQIKGNWLYTDSAIAYYSAYFTKHIYNNSLVIFSEDNFYLCAYSYSDALNSLRYFNQPVSFFILNDVEDDTDILHEIFHAAFAFIKEEHIQEICYYHEPPITAHYFDHIQDSVMQYHVNVDLLQSEQNIRMHIRKRYKQFVNWGERELDCHIMDRSNADKKLFNDLKQFHIEVAGRQTRSEETWDRQYEAILSEEAFVVLGYFQNKLAAGNIIMLGNKRSQIKSAYYGVGVYDRSLMAENKPISHFVILKSIFEAKRLGYNIFEFGDVTETDDAKYNDISKFKRGFSNTLEIKNVIKLKI